jgi:hypothetical protein
MLVNKNHIREILKIVKCHKGGKRNSDGYEMDCIEGVENAELAEFSSGRKQKGGPILATTCCFNGRS